jgi:hypothetical protein
MMKDFTEQLALARALVEVVGGEGVAQGFWTEVAEEWMVFWTMSKPEHAAEPAGIVKAQLLPGVEPEAEVIVLSQGDGGG